MTNSVRESLNIIYHSRHIVHVFLKKTRYEPVRFCMIVYALGEHGVVVRAFGLYWGGIRFESLSTHHCWSLSKSFIPSLVVWSMTKNNAFWRRKAKQKNNGEQSDLCDLEQVTLKPQLQVHHYLTTWLQIWYHSLLWGDSIRKGADLEKQNCLFGVHPAVMGKLTSLFSLLGYSKVSQNQTISLHICLYLQSVV